MKRRRAIRQGEICEFEEFYEFAVADLQGVVDQDIELYYRDKQELWEKALEIIKTRESNPDNFSVTSSARGGESMKSSKENQVMESGERELLEEEHQQYGEEIGEGEEEREEHSQ